MRGLAFFLFFLLLPVTARAETQRLVVLGDSLSAGYGLQKGEDLVTKLQAALIADGRDVRIDNAGVSGDTSAGGRSRLEWSIAGEPKPRLVIVALGGNDLLRGVDPATTRDNLSAILKTLQAKQIPAVLVAMKSPTNLGPFFQKKFDDIFDDLGEEYDVPVTPFLLKGIAMDPALNQPDGIHPNIQGVAVMVKNILPTVEDALDD